MSEVGEMFADHRKQGQEKRANNREQSTSLLQENGISFVKRNMGAHLIVSYEGIVVDFWPGTGKFIVRGEHKKRRGVFALLKVLGINPAHK